MTDSRQDVADWGNDDVAEAVESLTVVVCHGMNWVDLTEIAE